MFSKRLVCVALSLVAVSSVHAFDTDPRRIGPDTTVTFEKNKTNLTQASREKLDILIRDAREKGEIGNVQIAAWSDNPAPRAKEELSKVDRDLAEKRARVVSQYVKQRCRAKVDTYNMAERASWLARTLDTNDAELKTEIGRGGDQPMSRSEFQIFKDNGKASNAVVLMILKHGG